MPIFGSFYARRVVRLILQVTEMNACDRQSTHDMFDHPCGTCLKKAWIRFLSGNPSCRPKVPRLKMMHF